MDLVSAAVPPAEARRDRPAAWVAAHQERLAAALVGLLLLVMVGSGITAGFLLRHSANGQRQTLRLEALDSAALRGDHPAMAAALGGVQKHDAAAAERLIPASRAGTQRLQAAIDAEIQRIGRHQQSLYPLARAVLLVAAAAALLLVAALIWLFERGRRAGRIDRDNAERAKELARLRDEFVGVVSHELRTPLTSILGFIDLIEEDEGGALNTEYFGIVRRNAERLLYLVSDLLLIAESDDGRLRLNLEAVDLEAVAHESVGAARVAAEKKDIELTLAASPTHLEGDSVRLAQLLDNLISNAIKFTPDGGRVSVTTAADEAQASIEVRDSGVGITAADREQIFERFFRAHSASMRAISGAGLGLAITKAIVDAHGGTIDVESEPGKGSRFVVRLPLRVAVAA